MSAAEPVTKPDFAARLAAFPEIVAAADGVSLTEELGQRRRDIDERQQAFGDAQLRANELKRMLAADFGIEHATLEVEIYTQTARLLHLDVAGGVGPIERFMAISDVWALIEWLTAQGKVTLHTSTYPLDAINDAMRDWVTNVADTFYCIGTVAGPHPYPAMVRDFQTVIGMTLMGKNADKAIAG